MSVGASAGERGTGSGPPDQYGGASGDRGACPGYQAVEAVLPEIERCLKCGLCRAPCPIFAEVRDESGSARGRIAMIEALREGRLTLSPLLADRLSKCLNCQACMEACPSGIKVDEIVLAARAEIFTRGRFPWLKKLIFRQLLRRGRLLPPVSKTVAFIQRRLLRGLPASSPYRVLLPLARIDRDRILPVFAARTLIEEYGETVSPAGEPRMRVGLFVGCATNLIYTEVGRSAVRILLGEGIEVVIPRGQGCCGVPAYTAGDRETGRVLAERNIRAFAGHKVDAIVTVCATCGAAIKKDYGKVLGIEKPDLGARVYDLSEFLVEHTDLKFGGCPGPVGRDRRVRVTYHHPCHLSRDQGVRDAPLKVLQALPGVEFVGMAEADRCCGGAGTFSLSHYDLATAIGRRKAGCVAASGADVVVTSCPSCVMQLADMLGRSGLPQKVVNLAELVGDCYPMAGVPAARA